MITTLPLVLAALAPDAEKTVHFAPPVQVTTAGATWGDKIYPTPVLQDIDGDGARELVVGDLIGNLWVAEPGESEVAWAKHTQLETKDGKKLRLNNW